MNWPLLIIEITLTIIFFDILTYGFTTLILKWGKPYRKYLRKGILIEDGGSDYSCEAWQGARIRSLILTNEYLIFKQNYLTSVENINIESITQFQIKNKLIRKNWKKLILYIKTENKIEKFKFTTNKYLEWKKALHSLDIAEIIK